MSKLPVSFRDRIKADGKLPSQRANAWESIRSRLLFTVLVLGCRTTFGLSIGRPWRVAATSVPLRKVVAFSGSPK